MFGQTVAIMVFLKVLTSTPMKMEKRTAHLIKTSVPVKRMNLLDTFFLLGLRREEIADGEVGDIVLRVRRSGNELILLSINFVTNTHNTPRDYVTADEFFACVERCRGVPDGDACVKRCLGVVG